MSTEANGNGNKAEAVLSVVSPPTSPLRGISTSVPRDRQIFVNRPIRIDRLDWIGFDLDYTLALYKSPHYDSLTYNLLIEGLIKMGYPSSLKSLSFDPDFIIKGVCLDLTLGNVIKLGKFAQIVECYHGRQKLSKAQVASQYPSMQVPHESIGASRIEVMNTTYDVPKASVFCDIVEHLKSEGHEPDKDVQEGKAGRLSYHLLWNDIGKVGQHIHAGSLKKATLENLDKYVHGGSELALTLDKLRRSGKKLFLLTNSPWFYTNGILSWLLHKRLESYSTWTDFFDVIISDANKPGFFTGNEDFREISRVTGHMSSGAVDSLVRGKIYSGGNHKAFEEMCHIRVGDTVLYVGDHIFSDVMISKKRHAWRTLLIIPELEGELVVGDRNAASYAKVIALAQKKSELFESLDVNVVSLADPQVAHLSEQISTVKKEMRAEIKAIDASFNPYFGGMFRSGLHQSFFAMQVGRYADIYAASVLSFLSYSLLRSFTAPFLTLPHEGLEDTFFD